MWFGKLPPTDVPALMIWASTVPAIPLFLCCLPLGPWSSLFHILVLVLANLGHSSPSVKELLVPASETRRWTHTFSCHFQVQTSPLSCCGSSTGEELYKVQQSVPFKCFAQNRCDVLVWPWWSHAVIYGNRPLQISWKKTTQVFSVKTLFGPIGIINSCVMKCTLIAECVQRCFSKEFRAWHTKDWCCLMYGNST